MKLNYSAEHVFRFDLDEPFTYETHWVDRVRIEVMWVNAEGDEPEGWWIKADFYGWPLTAKGQRDKRVKDRERVYHLARRPYPFAMQALVWETFDAAVDRIHLDTDLIVNPNEGLFSEKVWEPAPVDVWSGNCSDCGIEVTYNNDGMWPFLGADNTSTCSVRDNGMPWGHRLDRTVADAMFATFERHSGTKARHF